MEVGLPAGVITGVGSLPHRDGRAAADFVLSALPELPAIPSLPNRSPAEGMLAQAAVGIRGVSIAADGDLLVDPRRVDPLVTDRRRPRPRCVRWPAGLPRGRRRSRGSREVAADRADHARRWPSAARACRPARRSTSRCGPCGSTCAPSTRPSPQALPACPQVVVLDEPGLTDAAPARLPAGRRQRHRPRVRRAGRGRGHGHGRRPPLRRRRPGGHPRHRSGRPLAPGASGPGGRGRLPRLVPRRRRLDRLGRGAHRPAGRHRRGPLLARAGRAVVRHGAGRLQPGAAPEQSIITPACGLALHSEDQAAQVLRLVGRGRRPGPGPSRGDRSSRSAA